VTWLWLAIGLWLLAVAAIALFFAGCHHDSDLRR